MTPILVEPSPLANNRTPAEIDAPTRLHGPLLWLARLAWFVIVALALAMLYQMLRVNDWDTWGEWVVQQARPATRPYMGIGAFIRYLIVLEWLGVGISLAAAFPHRLETFGRLAGPADLDDAGLVCTYACQFRY